LLGLGFTTFDAAHGTDALVVGLSVVGLVIAVGCFFAIRALVRSLRARAVAPAPCDRCDQRQPRIRRRAGMRDRGHRREPAGRFIDRPDRFLAACRCCY
jgi:hypothetical protein